MGKSIIVLLLFTMIIPNRLEKKPHVLIIGDSISIGYFPYVRDALEDVAIVLHNEGNAQDTEHGLQNVRQWLGEKQWDVIHFNWGLWDLCYRNPQSREQGHRDKIHGMLTATPEQFRRNLDSLVQILKQTKAKLIFATTTFVPEGEAGRFSADVPKYNLVATEVMRKYNVQIDDLYTPSVAIHARYAAAANNVHYSEKGYDQLARYVISSIKDAINEK